MEREDKWVYPGGGDEKTDRQGVKSIVENVIEIKPCKIYDGKGWQEQRV